MRDYTKLFFNSDAIAKLKKLGQKKMALIVVLAGILLLVMLVVLKRPPKKAAIEKPIPLVNTMKLETKDIQMLVSGFGTVKPKVEIEISPQVLGNIISVHPEFKAGGFIRAGATIVEIDPNDYKLAVEQAQAGVTEAEVALVIEKAEAEVAKQEWNQLHPGEKPTSPLVFREPQIRLAQAKLKSAEAALAVANLNLSRTKVKMPVDIRIESESADLGQFVTAGKLLGKAYGTEVVEIALPLEDKELKWFYIPDEPIDLNVNKLSGKVTKALVKAEFAGAEYIWEGYVVRTVGRIDEKSRMISVVIEVPKLFGNIGEKPPLMPGMFVEIEILGKQLTNVIAIPRENIHNRNEVWVVNNGHLKVTFLNIDRFDDDYAYVTTGVSDGTIIITSPLDTVTDNMEVNIEIARADMNEPADSREAD